MNLGGGGLVAGVRGTSVSIARTPTTQNYTIAIIDSTRIGIDAASIANTSTPSLTPTSVSSGTYLSYTSGTTTIPTRYVKSKTELLNIDPWIRDNTRADIDYLYIHSGSAQRIVDEYNATVPRSIDTLISDALCPEPAGATPTVKRLYWISLIPYAKYLDKCRENTLLAFADYTGSTSPAISTLGFASPMIYSGGTIGAGGTGSITLDGYSITATGQYISYVTGEFDRIGGLAGKTITIELGGVVGTNLVSNWTKAYIADFGTEKWFITNNTPCNGSTSAINIAGNYICKILNGVTSKIDNYSNLLTLTIAVTQTPTQMIIGNQGDNGVGKFYTKPIGTTIKNIRIQ